MRRRKDPPAPGTALPAMFVGGDEPAKEGGPPPPARSWLQDFFSLPPDGQPEQPSPGRPAPDREEFDGAERKVMGWLAGLVLLVVGKLVEPMIPLSDRQKYVGLGVIVVSAWFIPIWVSLHDSDLAYRDRDANDRMARFRNSLRTLFNIPVI